MSICRDIREDRSLEAQVVDDLSRFQSEITANQVFQFIFRSDLGLALGNSGIVEPISINIYGDWVRNANGIS